MNGLPKHKPSPCEETSYPQTHHTATYSPVRPVRPSKIPSGRVVRLLSYSHLFMYKYWLWRTRDERRKQISYESRVATVRLMYHRTLSSTTVRYHLPQEMAVHQDSPTTSSQFSLKSTGHGQSFPVRAAEATGLPDYPNSVENHPRGK